MHSKWMGRIGLAGLVMGVLGGSAASMGCAAERDPINRVQLNALPKSFFVGQKYDDPSDDPEFYARTMVIDVPYGESSSDFLMFTNTVNSVSKIKWSIEEKKLVGRVSFERVTGTDGKGPTPADALNPTRDPSKPVAQNEGLVVYEFNIESQFDIRRDYNPQTGEESNVVVENSSDRRWQERDYIRVDFSQNMVTTAYDFDTLSLLGVYNGITYAPLEFDITDPNDKNAPVLDVDNGYFDVTNKVFANPQMLDLGGGFRLPGCMLPNLIRGGTQPTGNCNPNEITLRHSFKRVVNTDYEPVDWDGFKFEAYGAFTAERFGYARDYGLADANWHRFIERYNIWERSHYYKDATKMEGAKACKVDADCSDIGTVSGMSRCDTFNEKCTLPFKDRKAKPIYWHYSDGSPELYFPASREASEEWDANLRAAIVASKYAECKRFTPGDDCGNPITGNWAEEENAIFLVKEINACRRGEVPGYEKNPKGCNDLAQEIGTKRGYSDATIAIAQMDPMVTLCHSPVSDKDPAGCGKVGTVARLGDLRYHLITNIAKVETNSPWGIMSDANDPTTGEKLAASVNVWTHVNDLAARGLIDTLRYIGGELKTQDVTDGTYIDNWVEAARQTSANGGTVIPTTMGEDELDKRVAAAAGTTVTGLREVQKLRVGNRLGSTSMGASGLGGKAAQLREQLMQNMKKVAQTKAAFDAPSVNAPLYEQRRNALKGTPIEAALITPAMQQLAQSSYGTLDPAAATAATSVFQGLSPQLRRVYEHRLDNALAARGSCIMPFEATAPLAYVAFADVLQQKFGKFNPSDPSDVQSARADKMKDYIRRRYQYAVIAHEMGHSFGLRHNFVSSSDAWNFRPQYWQLRTNDKKLSKTPCDSKGSSDGKSCVGPRWLDPVTPNETKNMIHMWAQSSTMEYPGEVTQDMLGLGRYDFGAARMFYGQIATVYDNARFRNSAGPGGIAQDHQDDFGGLLGYRYGGFSNPIHYSQLDGEADLIEKCAPVNIEDFKPANWNDQQDGEWHPVADGRIVANEQGQYTRCTEPKVDFVQWDTLKDEDTKSHAHDGSGRVRVPHGFASDDWADLGNIAVFRHDNGADLYETMHFWIAQQEMTHIFSSYRRGRTDFSLWGAFNRNLSRYHEKMRDSAKAISLYITLARDTVSQYSDTSQSADPQAFVADVLKQVATDNVAASAIAFDHFTHVFARPEPGEHGTLGQDDPVLRSFSGTGFANPGRTILQVPNGVTGGYGNISLGGRPIENALSSNKGRDYDRDYTLNVGSYYEKAFTSMLFTESADNFISASRDDFVDPRFRAVSLADVFPDGFRRWMGNMMTGDDALKGVFVRGAGTGTGTNPPDLDSNGFATLGNTSWWPTQGPEVCFPQGEQIRCRNPYPDAANPLNTTGLGPVIDPQVGFEQQKFAALLALVYLPENGRLNWVDQMRVWELGSQSDPGIANRIEFHDPTGRVLVAQTYGTETIFGKVVQKGIAARMLQYANEIMNKGVVCDPVTQNGVTWYVPKLDANGQPQYKDPTGKSVPACDNSRDCLKAKNYSALPKLMMDLYGALGWSRNVGNLKGVY